MKNKALSLFSLLGCVAAAAFFGCAVFDVTLGNVPLLEAGLFSLALGFVFEKLDPYL